MSFGQCLRVLRSVQISGEGVSEGVGSYWEGSVAPGSVSGSRDAISSSPLWTALALWLRVQLNTVEMAVIYLNLSAILFSFKCICCCCSTFCLCHVLQSTIDLVAIQIPRTPDSSSSSWCGHSQQTNYHIICIFQIKLLWFQLLTFQHTYSTWGSCGSGSRLVVPLEGRRVEMLTSG